MIQNSGLVKSAQKVQGSELLLYLGEAGLAALLVRGGGANSEITLYFCVLEGYHFFKGRLGQKQDGFVVRNDLLLPKILFSLISLELPVSWLKAASAAIILKLTSAM